MKKYWCLIFLGLISSGVLVILTTLQINLYQTLESEIINPICYVKSSHPLREVYCNNHQSIKIYHHLVYLENNVYEIQNETFLIQKPKPIFYYQCGKMTYLVYFFKVVFQI